MNLHESPGMRNFLHKRAQDCANTLLEPGLRKTLHQTRDNCLCIQLGCSFGYCVSLINSFERSFHSPIGSEKKGNASHSIPFIPKWGGSKAETAAIPLTYASEEVGISSWDLFVRSMCGFCVKLSRPRIHFEAKHVCAQPAFSAAMVAPPHNPSLAQSKTNKKNGLKRARRGLVLSLPAPWQSLCIVTV